MTDTYAEQLVVVKRSFKDTFLICLLGFFTILISSFLAFFALDMPIVVFFIALIIYGAYKLFGKFGTEYEYIFTNGDLDFDKISGKQNRKRIITVDTEKVERVGRYNAEQTFNNVDKKLFLCDMKDSSDKYFIISRERGEGNVMIVFSPNEKIMAALDKSIPRTISNGIFRS